MAVGPAWMREWEWHLSSGSQDFVSAVFVFSLLAKPYMNALMFQNKMVAVYLFAQAKDPPTFSWFPSHAGLTPHALLHLVVSDGRRMWRATGRVTQALESGCYPANYSYRTLDVSSSHTPITTISLSLILGRIIAVLTSLKEVGTFCTVEAQHVPTAAADWVWNFTVFNAKASKLNLGKLFGALVLCV